MRVLCHMSLANAVVLAVLAGGLAVPEAQAGRRSDTWITMKAKMALLTANDVDAMDINVDTVRGRVSLHGKVKSDGEKKRAEKAVRDIDGVMSVQNLLQVVELERERERVEESDEDIEEAVERAFESDPVLRKSKITVKSVNDGVVLLSGKAQSMSEYLQALKVARRVDGVRHVASQVKSPETLSDDEVWQESIAAESEGGLAEAIGDLWITSAVKMRLVAAEDVPAMDINVDTGDGVVTLFGIVSTEDAKMAAETEVRKVGGVKEVRNELQVVPEARREIVEARDDEIEREVKQALKDEKGLDSSEIRVEVENRVVRLSGKTDSHTDRLAAAFVARSVAGVRSVQNDLRVEEGTAAGT